LRGTPGSACPQQTEPNVTELPSCALISARAAQKKLRWRRRWWCGEEGARRPGPEGQGLRHVLWQILRNVLRRVLYVLVLHVSPKGRRVGGACVWVAARRSIPFIAFAASFTCPPELEPFTCRPPLPLGLPHLQRASNVQRARGDEETVDEETLGGVGVGGSWGRPWVWIFGEESGDGGGGGSGKGKRRGRHACADVLGVGIVRGRARVRVAARRRIPFLAPGFRRLKMARALMNTFTLPSSAAPGFRRLEMARATTSTFNKSYGGRVGGDGGGGGGGGGGGDGCGLFWGKVFPSGKTLRVRGKAGGGPCPFFEATPPGAAPGPPLKTGARNRHFRGCNNTNRKIKYAKFYFLRSSPIELKLCEPQGR